MSRYDLGTAKVEGVRDALIFDYEVSNNRHEHTLAASESVDKSLQ